MNKKSTLFLLTVLLSGCSGDSIDYKSIDYGKEINYEEAKAVFSDLSLKEKRGYDVNNYSYYYEGKTTKNGTKHKESVLVEVDKDAKFYHFEEIIDNYRRYEMYAFFKDSKYFYTRYDSLHSTKRYFLLEETAWNTYVRLLVQNVNSFSCGDVGFYFLVLSVESNPNIKFYSSGEGNLTCVTSQQEYSWDKYFIRHYHESKSDGSILDRYYLLDGCNVSYPNLNSYSLEEDYFSNY